ncbi:MAG: hypothetical protein DRR16_23780 [Candidatus Parabeggiatoa sp. nov. 3]|nr:MAG: hypothetical protein DRQ99_23330 [Gammaproteobacteria bacterium]RKZ80484.1 MAG: hypothetical protein DRR16_23780 [Gammaproteobacteria bacterium]HEW98906.1 hypothetical protein [Beggiatoa sp.]
MKKYLVLFILITMMNPAHSFLYVIHDEALNDSVLFTSDGSYYVGILNYYPGHDLEALDAHPQKWEVYAASGDNTDKAGYLYQVNPQTGELSEIGPTGFKEIEGLSFRADETLWAWAKGEGLIQVNPQTAESKLILPSEVEIEALTWKDEKVLYLAQGTELWKYDGQQLKQACDISKYTQGKSIEALEMMPNNTLVVGLHGKRNLLQLNVMSLDPCFISKSQEIASEYNDIEGIAYTKVSPLLLEKQGIWPNSLKPGVSTNVGVSIGVSGGTGDNRDIPPLLLEEITKQGPIILGQLYDDGTHGDDKANDYFYKGQFALQKRVEGEYCYRVKTAEPVAGVELVTAATCLWVVSWPTQQVPSEIAVDEGVIVDFTNDTSVLRIKEIILAEKAMVLEDIPLIKVLLIRIESEPRSNVIARFEKYPEVSSAGPNLWGTPGGEFPNNTNPESQLGFVKPEKLNFEGNSFESDLETTHWQVSGSCFSTSQFGQFTPTAGEKFLVCTTYPLGKTAWIKREIDIPYTSSLSINFDYNVITQENTASLNDRVRLSLVNPDGQMTPLVANVGELPLFDSTLHLPEGDMPIKQTGWQTVSVDIPITGSGKGFLSIIIHSENDPSIGGEGESNNLQSALLVDNIQLIRPLP